MAPSSRQLWTALALVGAVALGIAGHVVDLTPPHELDPVDLTALVAAAALGSSLALPRSQGRATTMSIAVVAAVAMMGQPPLVTLVMALAAWVPQAVQAIRRGGAPPIGRLLVTGSLSFGLGGVAVLAAAVEPLGTHIGDSELLLVPTALVWGLLLLMSPFVENAELGLRTGRGPRLRYRDLVQAGWQSNLVLAATATLGALTFPELGPPTVLLMALPLAAAKLGFDRNTDIRTTYDQTLRAMSRLPEQLGAVDPGHGVRAGEVASLAAMELGFSAAVVRDIERAAQLHELGRIRTEMGFELGPEEVAAAGAAIVTEAGELDRVAMLIDAHRGRVPIGDELAWVGGALIRLACDLDLRVRAGTGGLRASDEGWVYGQGVEPRIAAAIIGAAREHYGAHAPA